MLNHRGDIGEGTFLNQKKKMKKLFTLITEVQFEPQQLPTYRSCVLKSRRYFN